MTLGFSVETLLPAARSGAALRMGLSRLPEADWLDPAPDRAARAAAFRAHPESVAILPGAAEAGREVAAMLGVSDGLATAAASIHEDLCLVQERAGTPMLAGGAVVWPTDWRLADKLGLPIAAVHAPIHGYAEQLADGVDHFLTGLVSGPVFGRANWFVVASNAPRYLPAEPPATRFAHVTVGNAGQMLFVRCERQTLRRLPRSGAILFTIGIYTARLDSLSPAAIRRAAEAVTAVPDGEGARRAVPFYAEALAGYADGLRDRAAA